MGNHWTLQDAGRKLPPIVAAARTGVPQHISSGDSDAVVVLSSEEFERLMRLDVKPAKTFKEHLLDFPRLPDDMQDLFDKKEPLILEMHNLDFND